MQSTRRHAITVLVVGFTVIFLSSSIKNTFQVFFVQMAESFGQSRGSFATAAAVFMLAFGLASPIVGALSDRIGPKRTIQLGLVLSGAAFLGCATFDSFGLYIFFYGVVAAFGLTAMSYVPMALLVDQSFSDQRKGLAYATLTNGAAIGFAVLSPVWVFSQEYVAWQQVYLVLGVLCLMPLLVVVQILLPERVTQATVPAPIPLPFAQRLKAVLGRRPFHALMLGFFGCGVTMAFIDVHMVAHLQDLHLTPTQISVALTLLGISELIGGFLAGWMCDRFGKGYVIAGFYLIRAASLLVLLVVPGVAGAWLFAALFGISYLGTVVGTSMYTLSLFGKTLKGFAFGIIWLVHQLGAFVSTQWGANMFDWSGSYEWTVFATCVVAVISFVISLLWLPAHPESEEPLRESSSN